MARPPKDSRTGLTFDDVLATSSNQDDLWYSDEELSGMQALPERPPESVLAKGSTAGQSDSGLVRGLFRRPAEQVRAAYRWNLERGWGFHDSVFEEALKTIPVWPEERLTAVILVPYLPDSGGLTGIQRTFDELSSVVIAGCPFEQFSRWEKIRSDPAHLRLRDGIIHCHGVRWEVVDLGCNLGLAPESCNPNRAPHAAVLAAAAQHPEWLVATAMRDMPSVWASGYEVWIPTTSPWIHAPDVSCLDYKGVISGSIYAREKSRGISTWAVPELRPVVLGGTDFPGYS